jgi:Uma2 family endonuclease
MPGSEDVKAAVPRVKLTHDDYVQFPDDGKRHELIDGDDFILPTPVRKHQAILGNLHGSIWAYLRTRDIGRVFVAPFDVILSHHDVVEPDLIYVSHEREQQIQTAPWIRGAPNLVVEIGSPATRRRDETAKLRLYEQSGVDEYWIVDPEVDVIKVFRLVDGTYARAAELSAENGDVLTTPLLPDLELPLSSVFED